MKKIISLILILILVCSVAGCSSSEPKKTVDTHTFVIESVPAETDTAASQPADTVSEYSIVYNGVEIVLNAPAEPIISALGEPVKYTESTSCAFDGLDKTYFYGSLYVDTYPMGDKDFIYDFWFADDTIQTPEGIYIGSAQADVDTAYGAEHFNGDSAYLIPQGNGTLTIIIKEGVVSSIQYAINVK